ncbi:TPR domain protein, putative component of TonB system [Candidatus Burkholderia verschuerenii]|uniref:TPR domain protein, putative component of TonB system n=1 Tax=Candidatus Burkholderia verschuerenii TaxID=242163 RepID=A0A0L0M494_9BURK|nr:tetratricopeptide repeat protein [Candidatus Burkholderia verschuerenii]KND57101.1 TPR domain protein, putative component of TonB system [Candidatus Burkholderia verschuerenii]
MHEAISDAFATCKRAVRKGDWQAGLRAYSSAVTAGAVPDASARVCLIIAEIRSGNEESISELNVQLVRNADAQLDLKRLLVSPLIRQGALSAAAQVLSIVIEAWPGSADDHRTLSSVLGCLKHWDEAIAHADAAARIEPDDTALLAACLRLRMQAGQTKDAARLASETFERAGKDSQHTHAWITALIRGGNMPLAASLAATLDIATLPDKRTAAAMVQALLADERIDTAIQAGEQALTAGHDGATLRSQLGQAWLARGTLHDAETRALAHLAQGVSFASDDVRLVSLYGETLLRAGRYADAIPHLEHACALAPGLDHTRSLLARALRHVGRHAQAADELMALVSRSPHSGRWQRLAAAGLAQAGRRDEASALYATYLRARGASLPPSFANALADLDGRIAYVKIPRARLDWAWSLHRDPDRTDREQWERAARWGHLVDHLLLEWLECRDDRIEEAMACLGDLDDTERAIMPLMDAGKGVIVATAHVGPMYAGLMVLELLDIPSRWLSSTPGVSTASYASALISTADQSEAQVARESLRALQSGVALCIAVDGALNPAAPRVQFAGQEITYSSFAARAAHRLGAPSVFYAPRWENGRIVNTLERLPDARPGEDVEAFAVRWQQAYLGHLREYLAGAPENLRLSGGIWRHVRPVDRSTQPYESHR